MECMNCTNPIRATQPTVKCGTCTKNIHIECLNLSQDALFTVVRIKSPFVKFQCKKCSSPENKLQEVKNLISAISEDLGNRVTVLEKTVAELDLQKMKEEIKSEWLIDLQKMKEEIKSEWLIDLQKLKEEIKSEWLINSQKLKEEIKFECIGHVEKYGPVYQCSHSDDGSNEVSDEDKENDDDWLDNKTTVNDINSGNNATTHSLRELKFDLSFLKMVDHTMAKNKGKSKNKSSSKKVTKIEKKIQNKGNEEKEGSKLSETSEMMVESANNETEILDRQMEDEDEVSTSIKSETLQHETPVANKSGRSYDRQKETDFNKFKNNRDNREDRHRQGPNPKSRRSEPVKISVQHNQEFEGKYKQRRNSFDDNVADSRGGRNSRGDNSNRSRRFSGSGEYKSYEDEFQRSKGVIDYVKTTEIEGDLFQMPKEYSLAHCVAEDMSMGSGIAVQFRRDFKRVDELLNQHQKTGGLAVLSQGDRFIYYLVTKKHSTGKPTYATLFSSLVALRKHMMENGVTKLAMPRIGCGLDRLEWDKVKYMIEFIFTDDDVEIIICNLQQIDDSPQLRHRNCKLVNVTYPIHTIEEGTIILYFTSEDEFVSEEMKLLDQKFHYLVEFHQKRKRLGDVVYFTKNESYVLCGCIVKKSSRDPIDYLALQMCVLNIQKFNRNYQFAYVAFQAFKEEDDSCVNYKIINLLRNNLRDVEVYVCWVGDLQREMSARDRYSDSFAAMKTDWDRYDKRDSSPQRPFRQNSFSRKDNSSTSEDRNWRSGPRNESKVVRSLFESNTQKEQNTSKRSSINEEASTSHESVDWFEEGGISQGLMKNEIDIPKNAESSFESSSELYNQHDYESTNIPENASNLGLSSSQNENVSEIGHSNTNLYEKYKQEYTYDCIYPITVKELPSSALPKKYSRVCYVSEDMCLQSSLQTWPEIGYGLNSLLNHNKKVGDCEIVTDSPNHIFLLIVKKFPTSTCDREMVFSSIQQLERQAAIHKVKNLVVPDMAEIKDDQFDWSETKYMFEFLFRKSSVQIIFTSFPKEVYLESVKRKNKVKLMHVKHPLFQMKSNSIIIYWASVDGDITQDMEALDRKFGQLEEFKKARKFRGAVVRHKPNQDYVLYGCVIKEKATDPIDFIVLRECFAVVNRDAEPLKFAAVAAVEDADEIINYKIVNLLLNSLKNICIHYCWTGSLKDLKPQKNP